MTTAGERLVALSGTTGLTAAQHLSRLAAGATTGAKLVNWSGLPSATAAIHLLHNRVTTAVRPGGQHAVRRRRRRDTDDDVLLFLLRRPL